MWKTAPMPTSKCPCLPAPLQSSSEHRKSARELCPLTFSTVHPCPFGLFLRAKDMFHLEATKNSSLFFVYPSSGWPQPLRLKVWLTHFGLNLFKLYHQNGAITSKKWVLFSWLLSSVGVRGANLCVVGNWSVTLQSALPFLRFHIHRCQPISDCIVL